METPLRRMSLKEFLQSSLICLGLTLLYFQQPLLSTGVNQAVWLRLDPVEGLVGASEDLYLGHTPYYYAAKQIRRGRLPLWTPHASGGTPFMGNQQSGIFSPLHLPFYLVSEEHIQYLWIILFALCFYTAWSCMFVLARWHGISFLGSVFAAGWYSFSGLMTCYKIEMPGQTAVFTPGLFLAAEQFLRGDRRRALVLMPLLTALPALCGHFQISFFSWATVGIYVLVSLIRNKDLSWPVVAKQAAAFIGSMLLGLAIAAGPIAAGLEYISYSYTKVWRSLPEFGWVFERVARSLSWDDAASLIAAAVASWGFVAFLRRLRLNQEGPAGSWACWLGGIVALATASACLMNVGMSSPLLLLPKMMLNTLQFSHAFVLFSAVILYFLGLVALMDVRLPSGLKVVGGLVLFGSLLYLKTPLLIHLLYDLPVLRNVLLFNYNASIQLGLALLAGYGLARMGRLLEAAGDSRKDRIGAGWWQKTAQGAGLVVLGLALGHVLTEPLAERLNVGINPRFFNGSGNGPVGGIADAGKVSRLSSTYTVRGSISGDPSVQAVYVGLQRGGAGAEMAPAHLRRRGGRIEFSRSVALPLGESIPVAVFVNGKGEKKVWRGSDVIRLERPSNMVFIGLAAVFLLLPMLLLTRVPGRWVSGAGILLLAAHVFYSGLQDTKGAPRDNMTRPWPGIEKLRADGELYRIDSFDPYFFAPALSSVYGISDIRNGSDVLDVVTTIHFIHLTMAALDAGRQKNKEWGSQLLGWGNVKYVLAKPNHPLADGAFELVYRGADMLVYLNKNFQPRLRFLERWKYLDGEGLWQWPQARKILGAVYNGILGGDIDPGGELLLHDRPEVGGGQPALGSGAVASRAEIKVLEEDADRIAASVTTPRPGFLFFSSNYYPGWKCYIDGRPAKILRSWLTFCAVAIPEGRHQVRFLYHSWLVNGGLLLSVLGALAWALWRWRMGGGGKMFLEPEASAAALGRAKGKKRDETLLPHGVDGFPFIDLMISGAAWASFLFWVNWCAWIYRDGLMSKIKVMGHLFLKRKTMAELGYLGYPYAQGVFEGFFVNLAAALLMVAGVVAAARRWRKSAPGGAETGFTFKDSNPLT